MSKQFFETGYIRKVADQDLYEFIACDNIDEMFCSISNIYCFDDIDDTYQIIDIFCKGFRVEYENNVFVEKIKAIKYEDALVEAIDEALEINAKSAVLMEAKTGMVLYQKQEYQLIQQRYQQI